MSTPHPDPFGRENAIPGQCGASLSELAAALSDWGARTLSAVLGIETWDDATKSWGWVLDILRRGVADPLTLAGLFADTELDYYGDRQ